MMDYSKKTHHPKIVGDNVIPYQTQNRQHRETSILLLMFAVFLLASPFFLWWATVERPWYVLYLVWGGIILLVYLCQRWHHL